MTGFYLIVPMQFDCSDVVINISKVESSQISTELNIRNQTKLKLSIDGGLDPSRIIKVRMVVNMSKVGTGRRWHCSHTGGAQICLLATGSCSNWWFCGEIHVIALVNAGKKPQ